MQSFCLGKLYCLTPDANHIAAVSAKLIGLRMTYDDAVEAFLFIILTVIKSSFTTMTKQHDAISYGSAMQELPHHPIGTFFCDHFCFKSFIKELEHIGCPVLWMYY